MKKFTCISMEANEFSALLSSIYKDAIYVEYSADGLYVGRSDGDIPLEDLCERLAAELRVREVMSIHIDDSEPSGVWLAIAEHTQRIEIPLSDGFQLVAESSMDRDYKEIYCFLEDSDGAITQDLAAIGEDYSYSSDGSVVSTSGEYSVKVYSDANSEDYTHSFTVKRYGEGGAL